MKSIRPSRRSLVALASGPLAVIGILSACSDSPATTPASTGGSASTSGGTTNTGGSSSGGRVGLGGAANPASGGAPQAGGASGGVATITGGNGSSGAPVSGGRAGVGGAAGGTAAGGVPAAGSPGSSGAPSAGTAGTPTGGAGAPAVACMTPEEEKFSFYMISHEATIRESGSADGFGGDLGGIEGADAICQRVAEYSSACQTNKVWRAFLSTTKVDAIDRIGPGPWHDRLGRLLANNLSELLNDRPPMAAVEIRDDFPNEDGVPNRSPNGMMVDNHQTLTGTGINGRLYMQAADVGGAGGRPSSTMCSGEEWTVEKATCWDWTTKEGVGCPRVGHSWPREGSGINWISVWNEGGCLPGGRLVDEFPIIDGTRRVGAAGGYGGWYCFALAKSP